MKGGNNLFKLFKNNFFVEFERERERNNFMLSQKCPNFY